MGDDFSPGTVDCGTGRSSTWNELGGFNSVIDDTKRTWDEFCRVIPKMWTEERFSYNGTYFSMPERCVLPKPVQDPHPPLWVAVTAPGTEFDAADRGMGALILSIADIERNIPRIKEYRERIKRCQPVGAFVNDQVGATSTRRSNFTFAPTGTNPNNTRTCSTQTTAQIVYASYTATPTTLTLYSTASLFSGTYTKQ